MKKRKIEDDPTFNKLIREAYEEFKGESNDLTEEKIKKSFLQFFKDLRFVIASDLLLIIQIVTWGTYKPSIKRLDKYLRYLYGKIFITPYRPPKETRQRDLIRLRKLYDTKSRILTERGVDPKPKPRLPEDIDEADEYFEDNQEAYLERKAEEAKRREERREERRKKYCFPGGGAN